MAAPWLRHPKVKGFLYFESLQKTFRILIYIYIFFFESICQVKIPNFLFDLLCFSPRLNATDFLERLRHQKLVFVGDSLNRNMWESLVCILRHSVPDKKRVYEISGRTEFKKGGFYAFRFEANFYI